MMGRGKGIFLCFILTPLDQNRINQLQFKFPSFFSVEGKVMDSLYMVGWSGNLIEYVLTPHVTHGTEKVSDDSTLQLTAAARAQWTLVR